MIKGILYKHKPNYVRAFYVDKDEAKNNEDYVCKLIQEFLGPAWNVYTVISAGGRLWHIYRDNWEGPGARNYYKGFYQSWLLVKEESDAESAEDVCFTDYPSFYKLYEDAKEDEIEYVDLPQLEDESPKEILYTREGIKELEW